MRFPWNKLNQLEKQIDSLSNISVNGGNFTRTPFGQQFDFQPSGFYAKITGVVTCSTSNNPSSLTNTEAECCVAVGETTDPYTAYLFVQVMPDACGRWKQLDRTGIAYECNNGYVALNAIVWMMPGYRDDYRFNYNLSIGGSTSDLPVKCVDLPVGLNCEIDDNGDYTGRTEITYERFAVLDVDCGQSSGLLGGSQTSSDGGGGEDGNPAEDPPGSGNFNGNYGGAGSSRVVAFGGQGGGSNVYLTGIYPPSPVARVAAMGGSETANTMRLSGIFSPSASARVAAVGGSADCSYTTNGYTQQGGGRLSQINGLADVALGLKPIASGRLLASGLSTNRTSGVFNATGRLTINGLADTSSSGGQTVVDYTTAGFYTFNVPAGVSSVMVECLGGGGSGGGTSFAASGGGGGDYAKKNSYTVTPSGTLAVTVGGAGGDSYVGDASICGAAGGQTPGLVGFPITTVGDVTHTGGAGGSGSGKGSVGGGSGGTCAGLSANGNAGNPNSGATGGAAPTAIVSLGGTFTGGKGGTYNTVSPDNGQRGCGGGGKYTGGTNGTGGDGMVRITY